LFNFNYNNFILSFIEEPPSGVIPSSHDSASQKGKADETLIDKDVAETIVNSLPNNSKDPNCCSCGNETALGQAANKKLAEDQLFLSYVELMNHVFSVGRPNAANVKCSSEMDNCVNTCRLDA
jgi:hypothetical protein